MPVQDYLKHLFVGGEEKDVWAGDPLTPIPAGQYHQVVIAYPKSWDEPDMLQMFQDASLKGFRLLRVHKTDMPEWPEHHIYTGFVASDVEPKPINDFVQAIGCEFATIRMTSVDAAEQASLDALWNAKGAEVETKVQIPWGEIILGGTTIVLVGAMLLQTTKIRKKR